MHTAASQPEQVHSSSVLQADAGSLLAVSHEAMRSLAQGLLSPVEEEDDWPRQPDPRVGYQHPRCLEHDPNWRRTIRSTCSG